MNIKEPFVMLLVGPPLSGKSTWIRQNFPDTQVISRDEIVMELAGTRDYNKAFSEVNQKAVDNLLYSRLVEAGFGNQSVIIDMTNMTKKRRISTLSHFGDNFYKVAVIFPILSDEEYQIRNQKRISEENKDLPLRIIKNMISSYQSISEDEGFDEKISA
jgi:predicted kinase